MYIRSYVELSIVKNYTEFVGTYLTRSLAVAKQLQCGSILAKYNWETIFCGYYRSIFNHCDVISLQSYQIL